MFFRYMSIKHGFKSIEHTYTFFSPRKCFAKFCEFSVATRGHINNIQNLIMNHTFAFVMPITINFKHRSISFVNHIKACFSNLKNIIFIKKVSLSFWSLLVISNIHKIVNITIFIVSGSINAHITFLNEFVLQFCKFVFILSPGLLVRIIVCFKPLINSLNFFFYLVVKLVFLGRIICLFCYSNCLPIRIKFGLCNYRNWN